MDARPGGVASRRASLAGRFGPRLLLGLGNSHAPLVESVLGVPYAPRPKSGVPGRADTAEAPVPAKIGMLAALGPRIYPSRGRGRAPRTPTWFRRAYGRGAAALGPGITLARSTVVFAPIRRRPRAG